jgi:hypothetical protein
MINYKQAYEWLFDTICAVATEQCNELNSLLANGVNESHFLNVLNISGTTFQKIYEVLEESETKLEAAENEANK